MFLLTLCVEVSQSQGGFEVQSSQFMWLLLGAYLKSRNLDIRYHPTSCQKMSEGIIQQNPKVSDIFWPPQYTQMCRVKCKHQGFTDKLHRYFTIGSEGMYFYKSSKIF